MVAGRRYPPPLVVPEWDAWEVWCRLCGWREVREARSRFDLMDDIGLCPECSEYGLVVQVLPERFFEDGATDAE